LKVRQNDVAVSISSSKEGFILKPEAITYQVNVDGFILPNAKFDEATEKKIEELFVKSSKKRKRINETQ